MRTRERDLTEPFESNEGVETMIILKRRKGTIIPDPHARGKSLGREKRTIEREVDTFRHQDSGLWWSLKLFSPRKRSWVVWDLFYYFLYNPPAPIEDESTTLET